MDQPVRRISLILALAVSLSACLRSVALATPGDGLVSILVMGDSYSAGNGAGHYYGAKGCYRSSRNYGRQFQRIVEAAQYGQNAFVRTVACSGDTTTEFFAHKKGRPAQLDAVNHGYDLIFLTIGGNDVYFKDIVRYCLVARTRDGAHCGPNLARGERMMSDGTVQRHIQAVLASIQRAADPSATIVLLGYPYLEGDPGYTLRSGGRAYIHVGARLRKLGRLGDRIQQAAVDQTDASCAAKVLFVNTKKLFGGPPNHELYANRTNNNRWFVQPFSDGLIPSTFYHPNPTGWDQEARLLAKDSRVPKADAAISPCGPVGGGPDPGTGGGGTGTSGGGPDPGTGGGGSSSGVVALGPTAGPAGLEIPYRTPACAPNSDGTWAVVQVWFGSSQSVINQTGGNGTAPVESWIGTNGMAVGTYQPTFKCVSEPQGDVVWSDPGFPLEITQAQLPMQWSPNPASPGATLSVVSGAPAGPLPCPVIANSEPYKGVYISLVDGDPSFHVAASQFYDLTSPTVQAMSALQFTLPSDLAPNTSYRYWIAVNCVWGTANAEYQYPITRLETATSATTATSSRLGIWPYGRPAAAPFTLSFTRDGHAEAESASAPSQVAGP